MLWVGLFVLLPATFSYADTLALDRNRVPEWRELVPRLKTGDEITIDGKAFRLDDLLGEGGFGRVFRTKVGRRWGALKISKDPRVDPDPVNRVYTMAAQGEYFKSIAAQGEPEAVPEFIDVGPPNSYLLAEFIRGETWLDRLKKAKTKKERIFEIRKAMELFYRLEKGGLRDYDLKSLKVNIIYSKKRRKYVLIDPGGHEITGHPLVALPRILTEEVTGRGNRTLVPRDEAHLGALIRFELQVKDGKFPESKKRLRTQGPSVSDEGEANPVWVAEFVANAPEEPYSGYELPVPSLLAQVKWGQLRGKVREDAQKQLRRAVARLKGMTDRAWSDQRIASAGALSRNPLVPQDERDELADHAADRTDEIRIHSLLAAFPFPTRKRLEARRDLALIIHRTEGAPAEIGLSRSIQRSAIRSGLTLAQAKHFQTLAESKGWAKPPSQADTEEDIDAFALLRDLAITDLEGPLRDFRTQHAVFNWILEAFRKLPPLEKLKLADLFIGHFQEGIGGPNKDGFGTCFDPIYREVRDIATQRSEDGVTQSKAIALLGDFKRVKEKSEGYDRDAVRADTLLREFAEASERPPVQIAVLHSLGRDNHLYVGDEMIGVVNAGLKSLDNSVRRAAAYARRKLTKKDSSLGRRFIDTPVLTSSGKTRMASCFGKIPASRRIRR